MNEPKQKIPARILIVDDFVSNIQVLASMLRPQHYDIEFTTNGPEAINWLKQEHFDLVLLDIMMPEMDGFEVCTTLKNTPATKDIPIIFITAKTDEQSIQKGFQTGAVDYILKPFRETELIERVKTHVTIVQQRNALISTNQAKDRLFSIIGHDLKNPMSNIYGFIKLLHENYDTFDDEKKKQYLNYLFKSSKHNLQLLEELLEWSRTQTNSKPFKPKSLDIKKNIEEVLYALQENAQNKNIDIQTNINYDQHIFADPNMVKAVLRNLISNAIKFTPENGSVEIVTQQAKQQEYMQVDINDSGVGIPEKNLKKLFQIDEHVSTTGTNNEKGTGLGLILCKEFIEKHEGHIWAESELDKGSTFSFTIQLHQD